MPTRLFRPIPMEGFEWALPLDAADFDSLATADATAPLAVPPQMYLLREDRARRAAMPWLGSYALVLRDEAIEAVGPLLSPYGLLQPLPCNDARLAFFIARRLADAWDEATSDVVRFGSGRIMDLRRATFRQEVVAGAGAFRLAEMPRGHMYLTDELVEAIRRTGPTDGTDYEPA